MRERHSLRSKAGSGTKEEAVKDRQFVTALARGWEILRCFNSQRPDLSGSEIARLTGLPQPTVWRLCYTMLKLGILVQVAGDRLRPGLAVLQVGHSAISGMSLIELARPHMQSLANEFGGACTLAVRNGLDMVSVGRGESTNQLVMNLRIGSVLPVANSSVGWACIAGHDPEGREKIIALLDAEGGSLWKTHRADCMKALKQYDKVGYIVSLGMFYPLYNVVSAPIVAPDGAVPYTINFGLASSSSSSNQFLKRAVPEFMELVRTLTSLLAVNR